MKSLPSPLDMSRRGFLTSLAGTAALAGVGLGTGIALTRATEATDRALTRCAKDHGLKTPGDVIPEGMSYPDAILKWKKNPDGAPTLHYDSLSAEYSRLARAKPLQTWMSFAVADPIMEEFVFRVIPNRIHRFLFPDDTGLAPKTGLATTLIFALMHNLDRTGAFIVNALPITQILSGGLYWYLTRTKNEGHAIAAHAVHNGIVWALHYFKRS